MKELWNECSGWCWCGRNKRGTKEKTKEKSVGTWVEEKKRGGKKKKRREGEPTRVCVCVGREKKLYHNIFTINLKVGYY